MSEENPKDPSLDDETLRPEGMRALIAERESNKELKRQLKELTDAAEKAEEEKLSKEQAATKRAEKAENELKELQKSRDRDELVRKISEETGVPARLITGGDEKEMRDAAKDAEAFAKGFKGPRMPAPDPTQGNNNPPKKGTEDDAEALAVLGFGED